MSSWKEVCGQWEQPDARASRQSPLLYLENRAYLIFVVDSYHRTTGTLLVSWGFVRVGLLFSLGLA